MKDNFSKQSAQYAKFRPEYPDELYNVLISLVNTKQNVWDCGTGNGQVAGQLAKYFEKVYATDISQNQILHAQEADNIIYSVQPAENTDFPLQFFDLITVAQAVHWFDFNKFYTEAKRVLKPDGIIALFGYGMMKISDEVDNVISEFYENILDGYWDKERKYVDEHYRTIPFPFNEIETPQFEICMNRSFEHLIGYLETWSAVGHFIKQNGENPVRKINEELKQSWGKDTNRVIRFPVFMRAGKAD